MRTCQYERREVNVDADQNALEDEKLLLRVEKCLAVVFCNEIHDPGFVVAVGELRKSVD